MVHISSQQDLWSLLLVSLEITSFPEDFMSRESTLVLGTIYEAYLQFVWGRTSRLERGFGWRQFAGITIKYFRQEFLLETTFALVVEFI